MVELLADEGLGPAALGALEAHLSPWPGYTAALLSASALCLAIFKLRGQKTEYRGQMKNLQEE